MIQFYQQNSLKEYFKDVDTTLRTPYKQPEQSNSSNDTPNSTPGGSMRSFGVARARYDFSARDRSELSLRGGRHHQDPIQERSQWLVERRGVWPGEEFADIDTFITRKQLLIFKVFVSYLRCSHVSRWGSFQPTMWRRTTLTTADVAAEKM
uniref:Uncharacterized protein n=1 Tax=Lates calcarifer TaxID=8187 RepID=A0A4W6DKK4_LATCA